jgi:hypothetical protein
VYASTIHCRSLALACSSSTSVGSATFRIVLSILTTRRQKQRIARIAQRRS